MHEIGGNHDPDGDEVINLEIGGEIDTQQIGAHGAIAADPFLSTEKGDENHRRSRHQFGNTHRDHGENSAGAPGRKAADDDGDEQTEQSAHQGQQRHGKRKQTFLDEIHDVNGKEAR